MSVQRDVMETNYFGPIALTQGQWAPILEPINSLMIYFFPLISTTHRLLSPPVTALLPSMVGRRSGHIVVISSVQGKIAIPYRSACMLFPLLQDPTFFFRSRSWLDLRQVSGLCTLCSDAASKHATQAYFDCLRAEVERYGIHVSVISPGYIRTNLSLNAVTGDGSKHGGEAMKQVLIRGVCWEAAI